MGRNDYHKNRNIKGIAESIIREIEEDEEDIEDLLDHYLQRAYWSHLQQRHPAMQGYVAALIQQYIEELEAVAGAALRITGNQKRRKR